jgi:response regulator RpfG family c-di-GMP phosphodiesterase
MSLAETARRSVTVVDDEPSARDVLVRAATAWRFSCQSAENAEQALALLERSPTPVVVTDLRMPGRGGVWLVGEVRRRWPEVGVVVLTAGADDLAVAECRALGAQHFFFKPIQLDEFRHVLDAAVRGCRRATQDRAHRDRLETAVRRQTRRVRRTFLSAIDSLVRTMEERDPCTAGHSVRVFRYSVRLAESLDLSPRQRRQLGLAARLHDIGKVGVPEAVLHKPTALTDEELVVVRAHPVIGERILAPIIRELDVLEAIRGHHERLDGSGYPDGLAGDAIPFLARVVAVPDCFDALTTSRAYRPALPVSRALGMLCAGSGTHFEPDVVRAFLKVAPQLIAAG